MSTIKSKIEFELDCSVDCDSNIITEEVIFLILKEYIKNIHKEEEKIRLLAKEVFDTYSYE